MFDDLIEIFSNLKRNKLRTILTGLSVSMGIFLLIVVLSAGNGLIHAIEFNSGNMALDVMEVYAGYTSKPYGGLEANREIEFDNRDIGIGPSNFPKEVEAASGILEVWGSTLHVGSKSSSVNLTGCYPEHADINKINITYGRFINHSDLSDRRKNLVIGEKTALEFFPSAAEALGKVVSIDSTIYTIVGLYGGNTGFGAANGYIPFTTLQTIYKKGVKLDGLKLRTRGITEEADDTVFQNKFRAALSAQHRFAPDDKSAVWMYNTSVGAAQQSKGMNYIRTSLWIVGLLTLLSGIVGISNIMLITVKERTHEFGIRKALGARPWQILRSVLIESMLITFVFGYIGLLLGIIASEYMNYVAGISVIEFDGNKMYTFLNPTIDLTIAMEALAVLIIAGLLAGFFPARKAVKVKPIEALHAK
ncbi:MAG: ABC transporter permease [Alloprevotella sp.]|nr:ABC transporter permease [Alloprevotella sp.]